MSELDYYRSRFVEEIGVSVVLKPGESLYGLMKRFKKKFTKSGLGVEMRDKAFYDKPSTRKKKKRELAERRRKREEAKLLKVGARKKSLLLKGLGGRVKNGSVTGVEGQDSSRSFEARGEN